MQVHINLEIQKENGSISNQRAELMLNDIKDLKAEVTKYFINNFTWCGLISYRVIARLDGSCDTIDKNYYQRIPCRIMGGTETYSFKDGKPTLVKHTMPIVYE
jgi:hypothetical protein